MLAEISSQRQNYPNATAYLLSPSREGFPREFLQSLNDLRISLTIPVQFFDSPFKVDEAPQAASAIRDLRSTDPAGKRVAQPFRTDASPPQATDGPDLFAHLRTRLTNPQAPAVHVIVGKAGMGKSFLFNALFARLYDNFLDEKRHQRTTPRPIPLVPTYLKGLYALRTELLIDNFLRTDVASPVGRDTFEWLLVNGFATWLLDGLDELYTGDANFFYYLLDLITRPNSRAQITIWCRDSLLTTSDAFAEFRMTCGTDALELYHLNDWERSSKRAFAWIRIEGRHPRAAEWDSQRIAQFLQTIDDSPTLRDLSRHGRSRRRIFPPDLRRAIARRMRRTVHWASPPAVARADSLLSMPTSARVGRDLVLLWNRVRLRVTAVGKPYRLPFCTQGQLTIIKKLEHMIYSQEKLAILG